MANSKGYRSSRKNSVKFRPNRTFIKSAMEEYLKNGGQITMLETQRNYADIIGVKGLFLEADEFLAGEQKV